MGEQVSNHEQNGRRPLGRSAKSFTNITKGIFEGDWPGKILEQTCRKTEPWTKVRVGVHVR